MFEFQGMLVTGTILSGAGLLACLCVGRRFLSKSIERNRFLESKLRERNAGLLEAKREKYQAILAAEQLPVVVQKLTERLTDQANFPAVVSDTYLMESFFSLASKAALIFLAVLLIFEYAIRRWQISKESVQNRQRQQQLAAYSAELKELKKKLARKSEVAEKLPQFTKKMADRLSHDSYPPIVVRFAKDFFHAEKIGYFAPMNVPSEFTLVVGAGLPTDWVGKVRIDADEGMLGHALRKKVVVSRLDSHNSIGRRSSGRSLEDHRLIPDFVAPVFGVSGIVGALVIAGCFIPIADEKANVSLVADLLSTMLQKTEVLDLERSSAWTDHLTGVANRLYFFQRLEIEIRRTQNYEQALGYKQALGLFIFDIDNFKKINDAQGHHAGDVVLRKLAEFVKFNIRSSDLVGRFGGDEFMVLIKSTTAEQAKSFVEILLKKIATADIAIPGSENLIRITISGGLAMFPTHGQSTTDLFKAADEALYESKRQGRNRITVAISPDIGVGTDMEAEADQGFRKQESEDAESGPLEYDLRELDEQLRLTRS